MADIINSIINNIIQYQKKNNVRCMCVSNVTFLYEFIKYWFKNIHVITKPSILICIKAGQRIVLSGHINIIINGVLKETSYDVLNLINESDSYVYYHNWSDSGLNTIASPTYARERLKEFLYFNFISNAFNSGQWSDNMVEDENTTKYLDELQRVTHMTYQEAMLT